MRPGVAEDAGSWNSVPPIRGKRFQDPLIEGLCFVILEVHTPIGGSGFQDFVGGVSWVLRRRQQSQEGGWCCVEGSRAVGRCCVEGSRAVGWCCM